MKNKTIVINHSYPLRAEKAKPIYNMALLVLCLCFSAGVLALPEDSEQPIDVAADSASVDDKTGVTILTGAVKIVQGTMVITADTVTIRRDAQGNVNEVISVGKPAYFTQQQLKNQPHSKAWGTKMVYLVSNQTITITGNARIEQLNDKFSGETIVYEMDRAVVKATGGKQRVKMVIQPKGKK